MGRASRIAGVAVTAVAVALGTVVAPATPASAAGITTHAWMAIEAIGHVQDPALAALLTANVELLRAGAQFPDGGYAPGNVYGEEAHWQRFADAYADRIRARSDCGDLTDPAGPCAPEIAHLMGVVAHGMGDQTWDWLFEPNSPDLGEYYLPPEFSGVADAGGQELQLDLVAIADHGQPTDPTPSPPSEADLLAAFTAAGFVGATPSQLQFGALVLNVIKAYEASVAPQHIDALRQAMPWMSANFVTAPGGVDFSAVAIAGVMDAMWGRLLGHQPPTAVSITYPADGERRVPPTGWSGDRIAGSNPGSGHARTRITAALTYSRPYVPSASGPGSVPRQLPAGAMTLTEAATGQAVPLAAGYPKSVPYGPDAGEHLVDLQPAGDLSPCTWYRAAITGALVDARGQAVEPMSWRFRTAADAEGGRCPGDPYVGDEQFVAAAYQDLLGKRVGNDGLDRWLAVLADGGRGAVAEGIVGMRPIRVQLVTDTYQTVLARQPSPGELDQDVGWLKRHTPAELTERLLRGPEAFTAAGGTRNAFVHSVYGILLGRAPTAEELQTWMTTLDGGASRRAFVHTLLTSTEAADHAVADAYDRFLDRPPTGDEQSAWRDLLLAGGDVRQLWTALIAGPEYPG